MERKERKCIAARQEVGGGSRWGHRASGELILRLGGGLSWPLSSHPAVMSPPRKGDPELKAELGSLQFHSFPP